MIMLVHSGSPEAHEADLTVRAYQPYIAIEAVCRKDGTTVELRLASPAELLKFVRAAKRFSGEV